MIDNNADVYAVLEVTELPDETFDAAEPLHMDLYPTVVVGDATSTAVVDTCAPWHELDENYYDNDVESGRVYYGTPLLGTGQTARRRAIPTSVSRQLRDLTSTDGEMICQPRSIFKDLVGKVLCRAVSLPKIAQESAEEDTKIDHDVEYSPGSSAKLTQFDYLGLGQEVRGQLSNDGYSAGSTILAEAVGTIVVASGPHHENQGKETSGNICSSHSNETISHLEFEDINRIIMGGTGIGSRVLPSYAVRLSKFISDLSPEELSLRHGEIAEYILRKVERRRTPGYRSAYDDTSYEMPNSNSYKSPSPSINDKDVPVPDINDDINDDGTCCNAGTCCTVLILTGIVVVLCILVSSIIIITRG